jgi:SAM-dependent methyltransferase
MAEWSETADFDLYAGHYDESINKALSLSGENRDYFALKRVEWLAARLTQKGFRANVIMDFGCGTGSASPLLSKVLAAKAYIGVDTSQGSLNVARKTQPGEFYEISQYNPAEQVDLIYCNGVFHHIALDERRGAVDYLYRSLRAGGILALWENNPLNPVTRYMMSRIPFDRSAITLRASEAVRLAESGGFRLIETDHLFLFPRWLSVFRPIEPYFSGIPMGAQYQVLCLKPTT